MAATSTTDLELIHSKSQKQSGAFGRVFFTKLKTKISQNSSTVTTIAKRGHKRVRSASSFQSFRSAQSGDFEEYPAYKDKDDDWVQKWLSDSNL